MSGFKTGRRQHPMGGIMKEQDAKHFKTARQKASFGYIILALLVILTILPVSFSIFYFYRNISVELEKTASATVDYYIDRFTDNTEYILNSLRGSVFILCTDASVREVMRQEQINSGINSAQVEAAAGKVISANSARWQSCVNGIYLLKSEEDYISVLPGGRYRAANHRVEEIYRQYGTENSARRLIASEAFPGFCYLVVDYFDTLRMESLGKIIIEVNTSRLVRDSYFSALYAGNEIYLTDANGKILYGDREPELTEAVKGVDIDSGVFVTVGDKSYYHAGSKMELYGLQVDVFIPREEIFSTVDQTVKVYIVLTLLVLALTLAIGIVIYILLLTPLRQMMGATNAIAKGDLTVRVSPTPYRETEVLGSAFNEMAESLTRLFDDVYEKGVLLREAEYAMLEAQINPHFIFNVLEVINMRAMAAGQTDTCRMVSNLSKLIRSNVLNKYRQKITFGQEIDYVRYYLELQKERFPDTLHYAIHLEDDALLAYYLPKLTIQPIVENSVVHGIENKREGGTVAIAIWEEEAGIYVRVTDDGIGFDTKDLDLEKGSESTEHNHNHVALYNINRRIQLLYGKDYGLSVESSPGKGTVVTVFLPLETEEENR